MASADDEVHLRAALRLRLASGGSRLCGPGPNHRIIIRDQGDVTSTDEACRGGGGYDLVLEVFNANGVPLPQGRVRLGGGAAAQSEPRWLREDGFALHGPRLDDTALP